jgi:hypothetical protein
MHDARDRRPAFVADRVGAVVGCGDEFRRTRDELRRDRIRRVSRIDQRRNVRSESDRKLLGYPPDLLEPAALCQTGGNNIFGADGSCLHHQVAISRA